MSATIVPISHARLAATGKLTVSSIKFYCAPGRADGLVVNLGVIAEIVVPKLRGLGLMARPELTQYEMQNIGELGRRLLVSPFSALSKEFDIAWAEAGPGHALDFLRERHAHSLRIEQPELRDVPHRLFMDGQPVRSLVRSFLSEVLDEESSNLIALNDGASPLTEIPGERFELKPAA